MEGPLNKPEAQQLLHAVEELYFFRRYEEAARFARQMLAVPGVEGLLDNDTVKMLRYYEEQCLRRC